jgi:hypothetical protein
MNSSVATIDAVSVALSFFLGGLKTTNQSRHDIYEDCVLLHVVSGKGISGHFIG